MAQFSTLRLSTHTPHEWTLDDDFTFRCEWLPDGRVLRSWCDMGLDVARADDGLTVIRVPGGTTTDLGSSPRALWWFCSPVDIAMASVVHDRMYGLICDARRSGSPLGECVVRRREADDVFLMALYAQPAAWWPRAWAAWLSVRVFGWLSAYGLLSAAKWK